MSGVPNTCVAAPALNPNTTCFGTSRKATHAQDHAEIHTTITFSGEHHQFVTLPHIVTHLVNISDAVADTHVMHIPSTANHAAWYGVMYPRTSRDTAESGTASGAEVAITMVAVNAGGHRRSNKVAKTHAVALHTKFHLHAHSVMA